MNKEEVIARFNAALREQGWVFYAPELLWRAYRRGLLKHRYAGKYLNAVPEEVQRKMSNFLEGQTWERRGANDKAVKKEAAPLPEPTFIVHPDWKVVIAHCGLKGVGAGKTTESRAYRSLYVQSDGSISELVKVPIHFKKGHHETPLEEGHSEFQMGVDGELEEIFQSKYNHLYGSVYLTCYLIIQTDFFPKERITKLRRRIEDRLRKGAPDDIIRVAKSLNVK